MGAQPTAIHVDRLPTEVTECGEREGVKGRREAGRKKEQSLLHTKKEPQRADGKGRKS